MTRWGIAGLVAVATACGGAARPAEPPAVAIERSDELWSRAEAHGPIRAAPFGVAGEQLIYHISIRGLAVGRLRIAVGTPGVIEGRRAVLVSSSLESDGLLSIVSDLSWVLESTVDLDTGHPIHSSSEYHAIYQGTHERDSRTRDWPADTDLHNLHSAVGVLRGWDPAVGEAARLDLRIGGRFDIELLMAGREYAQWAEGPVMRIEGRAHIGRSFAFTVWLSDDAHRVPVRFDTETILGPARVELVSYDAPARP
ncbi:MAG TPA: DUF3108 domain-containing protein [Kofleriaceae bacterium]|nr:DUF3108 domain-containing protein [Kofleriaceae bacterium]